MLFKAVNSMAIHNFYNRIDKVMDSTFFFGRYMVHNKWAIYRNSEAICIYNFIYIFMLGSIKYFFNFFEGARFLLYAYWFNYHLFYSIYLLNFE